MNIGISHCGWKPRVFASSYGDYPQLIKDAFRGGEFHFGTECKVFRGDFPVRVDEMDAWFLTGSPTGVYESESNPWIERLLKFIREAYTAGVPMVGICFGHQAIAEALGGRVDKYRAGWALGVNTYQFQGNRFLRLFALHQHQDMRKPDMAEVIAENTFTKYAGLKYGTQIVSFQFHPEITKKAMGDILEDECLPENQAINAKRTLSQKTDEAVIIKYIREFLKQSQRSTHDNCCSCFWI